MNEEEKREICKNVLSTGINDKEEMVIAGSFYDYYPYKKRLYIFEKLYAFRNN